MIRKLFMAGLAGMFAVAMTMTAPVNARPVVGSGSQIQIEKNVEVVKKKKKKKKAKKSKAGKCGAFKYYSKKAKKCVDARDKK